MRGILGGGSYEASFLHRCYPRPQECSLASVFKDFFFHVRCWEIRQTGRRIFIFSLTASCTIWTAHFGDFRGRHLIFKNLNREGCLRCMQ
jgi:hypothetical protein